MKSKKLITLAIPVMLLGGCATIQDSPKKETKTEESSKAKATEQDKKSTSVNYPPLNILTDCLKWGLLG
ncbi:hypothetical protein ACQUW6_26410 [Bacillus thuringiensis]|uniref:hypothetical protein n=1 Tax=Bacillus cereus group TaxID=86661 RepID=UPI001CFD9609